MSTGSVRRSPAKSVLIENSEAAVSPLYWVAGYERGHPVQAAVLDIVEVGAGGGSVAAIPGVFSAARCPWMATLPRRS